MYEEIADKIYFVEGENRGRDPYSNAIIIDDQVKVLIDTGIGPERIKQVAKDFSVDQIILSHGHEDHIAGNRSFPNARIGVHHQDSAAVRDVRHQLKLFGVLGTELEEVTNWILKDIFQLRNSRIDFEFADGEQFSFGNHQLQVIHTPGHCAGHCCFSLPSAKLLFLADISLSSFGPLYNKIDSDLGQFISSIEKVKTLEFEVAVSSHKGVYSDRSVVMEELQLFLDKIYERDDRLLDFLMQERTLDQITEKAIVYGTIPEPRAIYSFLERTMITRHIDRLLSKRRIISTPSGYVAC